MQQLTAPQLHAWLNDPQREKPMLLDVRQPWEFDVCRIAGARSMPMSSIPARHIELSRDAPMVIVCHHGARSYQVAMFLENLGFSNIYNLYGGMAAWSQQVDPTTPTY